MNERLKRGISLVEAEARALVPAQPGKMKTIKWLGIKAPAEKPEEFKMKIPDTVQTTPETANKLKEARQIMGGRLILPDAVESALGTRIDRRLVNHFPFSEEQLKRLSRDSVVMYFADETETGQPITMRWLEEIKAAKVKRIFKSLITKGREIINSDYTQTPDNRYAGHEFYESQTPRPGWRSFTVNVVPESKNKDALGQTDALIDHLKSKTFKDITLPEDIQSAVKDYYSKKRQIRDVMIKDPVEATRLLMDLDLIKFTRVTAVELSYASHVLSEVYQRRFLAFERSTTLSCDTRYPEVFTIGNFDLQPDKSISAKESVLPVHPKRRYPDTGAVLSVGADALPTPPQTEETKLSNTSQDQALIKHAATPISFDRQIANNLLFEYRLKQEKLPFDPERDITDNDWKGMTEALVKVREEMDISPYGYSEYLQLLHRMRVLCPKKFSMIDSSMLPKEKDFDFISGYNKKQMLGYALERTEGFTYAHQYMTEASLLLRQAFPDKTQPWDEKKLQQTYQSIVEYNNSKVSYDLGMLARLNILFPNWISENFLNEHNTKRENVQSSINTNFYILSAEKIMEDEANFRILTGDNNHRLDWDIIKQAINSARTEGRNRTFARLCELAMILAAEEVKITDKGLEINMRKPEKKSAPAILTDRKSDSEPVFDPERDIPDSEQLGMFNEMDDLRRESNSILISRNSSQAFPINTHRKYIAYALSFRRLFPETFQAIQK